MAMNIISKEKKEIQQEKLKGLGVYKEATELTAYLEKFERIMRECGVTKREWSERLFPRLTERLCARIAQVRDEGADYEVVKNVLLKAVGETALTYGTQLFEWTGESLKSKTAGEIMDIVERVCRGTLQGCESVSEAILALAMAFTRRVIPPGGKVFLENKKITTMGQLREAWEDWMVLLCNTDVPSTPVMYISPQSSEFFPTRALGIMPTSAPVSTKIFRSTPFTFPHNTFFFLLKPPLLTVEILPTTGSFFTELPTFLDGQSTLL